MLLEAERRADTEAQRHLVEGIKSYRDVESRQYIHLVDGGISDNLGLRSLIERFETLSDISFSLPLERTPKNVVIILVNAEVKPELYIERSAEKPSAATTMSAFTGVQMNRYNQETLDRLKDNIRDFEARAKAADTPTKVYFLEISFDQVKKTEVSAFLNSLPTSLELEDIEVDRLIGAGRLLLRHEPQFKRFKRDNNARLAEDAITEDDICRAFDFDRCQTEF